MRTVLLLAAPSFLGQDVRGVRLGCPLQVVLDQIVLLLEIVHQVGTGQEGPLHL